MKKRILSIVLTICLLMSLIPQLALAEDDVEFTVIDGTQGNSGEGYDKLFDGNHTSGKWCANTVGDAHTAYLVIKASASSVLNSYSFWTGNDTASYPGRNPKSWNIYGANDYNVSDKTATWDLLTSVENDETVPAENFGSAIFTFDNTDYYKYYKIEITATHGEGVIQLSEIELNCTPCAGHIWSEWTYVNSTCTECGFKYRYCCVCFETESAEIQPARHTYVDGVCTECSAVYSTSLHYLDGSGGQPGEGSANALDGKKTSSRGTKWCVDNFTNSYLIFKTDEKVYLRGYTITTANDTESYSERNPKSWEIYGCNDYDNESNAGTWVLVDKVEDDNTIPAKNYESASFAIENNTNLFLYYKFNISAVHSGRLMQIAEFEVSASPCKHEWRLDEVLEPTCTEKGKAVETCLSDCGETVTSDIDSVPALGHSYNEGYCDRCGAQENVSFKAVDGINSSDWNQYDKVFDGYRYAWGSTRWIVSGVDSAYVVVKASDRIILNAYTLYAASSDGENPKSWTVFGSNDYNETTKRATWNALTHVEDDTTMVNSVFKGTEYKIADNEDYYQYYKFDFSEFHKTDYMSLEEIELSYTRCHHNRVKGDATPPTCTTDGYSSTVCTVCGIVIETKSDAPLGHDFSGDPVEIREATCSSPDYYVRKCLNGCGEESLETVKNSYQFGHHFVNGVCLNCDITEEERFEGWNKLTTEHSGATIAGHYYLDEDVTLTGRISISAPALFTTELVPLVIDLNGHVLTIDHPEGEEIEAFIPFGSLVILDSSPDVPHKFTPRDDGLWVHDEENGTETVYGGIITGAKKTAVYLPASSSYFFMLGGSFVGCTGDEGGAIYAFGDATMVGGSIIGCTASSGGAVFVTNGGYYSKFTMLGGTVRDCTDNNGNAIVSYMQIFCGGGTIDGKVHIAKRNIMSGSIIKWDEKPLSGTHFLDTLSYGDGVEGGIYYNGINEYTGEYYQSPNVVGTKISFIESVESDSPYAIEIVQNGNRAYEPLPLQNDAGLYATWYKDADLTEPWNFENDTVGDTDFNLYAGFGVKLDKIEITTPPTVCEYSEGKTFNPDGMVVTAYYTDGTSKPIYNYTLLTTGRLELGTNRIHIAYTEGFEIYTASYRISVTPCTHTEYTTNTVHSAVSTCDVAGYNEIYCDNCGNLVETAVLPLADHEYGTYAGYEATCTAEGRQDGEFCIHCGVLKAERAVIPAKGHSYGEWTVEIDSTTETVGTKVRICSECGDRDEAEIPLKPAIVLNLRPEWGYYAKASECAVDNNSKVITLKTKKNAPTVDFRFLNSIETFKFTVDTGSNITTKLANGTVIDADSAVKAVKYFEASVKNGYTQTFVLHVDYKGTQCDYTVNVIFDYGVACEGVEPGYFAMSADFDTDDTHVINVVSKSGAKEVDFRLTDMAKGSYATLQNNLKATVVQWVNSLSAYTDVTGTDLETQTQWKYFRSYKKDGLTQTYSIVVNLIDGSSEIYTVNVTFID